MKSYSFDNLLPYTLQPNKMDIEEEFADKLDSFDDDIPPVAMVNLKESLVIAQEDCFHRTQEVAGTKILKESIADDNQPSEVCLDQHRKEDEIYYVPSSTKSRNIYTDSDNYIPSFDPQQTLDYFRDLVSQKEWPQYLEPIGRGATSHCFKYDCKLTNIQVAAKMLNADSKRTEQQLQEEARILQRVMGHDNVLNFIGAEMIGGDCWILTRYEAGGTVENEVEKMRRDFIQVEKNSCASPGVLEKLMGKLRSARTELTLRLAPQLFGGLLYIHELGIAHLDIKTENLLLDWTKQRLIIADFGSAKEVDSNGRVNIGKTIVGTAGFLAPEIVNHEAECGTQCDMYSAGVCIFIMITGHHPYGITYREKDSEFSLIYAAGRAQDITPSAQIPEPLNHVIYYCLRKDPQERISAAEAFYYLC